MRNILGLDLGTGSIGWALIRTSDDNGPEEIIDMGVREVPLSDSEEKDFTRGQSITKNADRTLKRTARKCYDRYQLRREALVRELNKHGMQPDDSLIKLSVIELWQLRANAATKQISLPELGRVLFHLNQKRGYKHAKEDNSEKQRSYVAEVNKRYSDLKERKQTIGQYFAQMLVETSVAGKEKGTFCTFRIKDKVYPRAAYEEEYDKIMACQKAFYPDLLTDEFIDRLRNEIIYYQRKLKSCTYLISTCELERRYFKDADGNIICKKDQHKEIVYDGPKVAPITSPLSQLCKNWEAVNNIKLYNRRKEELYITQEQRRQMVEFLNTHDVMKRTDVFKILGIDSKSGWYAGLQLSKGLKGNSTMLDLTKALSSLSELKVKQLLQFDLTIKDATYKNLQTGEVKKRYNLETGEVLQIIDNSYQQEPLFRLWHIIYSVSKEGDDILRKALKRFLAKYDIDDSDIIERLVALDFVTPGFGKKSSKAMSKILPYMMQGVGYSDACDYVGYNKEKISIEPKGKIPLLRKNELRQPTVEKILNQMINVFNGLNERLKGEGKIDAVRVELARELRQNKEERKSTYHNINKQERENDEIAKRIQEEGVDVTRTRIQKYKMWQESSMCCFYCDQIVNLRSFLTGSEVEREHIIPKRLLFDNSFSNQVCSCRACNVKKGGMTAFDFMRTQNNFDAYLSKIDKMFQEGKISRTKHDRLLASYDDYLERKKVGKETKEDVQLWENFIERQLRLSQYISKKARVILLQGCKNVYATSGSVTDFVRHVWGYDTILHDLNFERYKNANLTEIKIQRNSRKKEVIKDWTKRKDHRHHAVDALVIACTSQGMIQRINTLNASREDISKEIQLPRSKWKDSDLLEEWIKEHIPFSHTEFLIFIKCFSNWFSICVL